MDHFLPLFLHVCLSFKELTVNGQWLCCSWKSGYFLHQRSAVRIQSLSFLFTILKKTKIKKKRPKIVQLREDKISLMTGFEPAFSGPNPIKSIPY